MLKVLVSTVLKNIVNFAYGDADRWHLTFSISPIMDFYL